MISLILLTIFVPRDDESLLWCLDLLGYTLISFIFLLLIIAYCVYFVYDLYNK